MNKSPGTASTGGDRAVREPDSGRRRNAVGENAGGRLRAWRPGYDGQGVVSSVWAHAPEGGGADGPKRKADRGRDSFSWGREWPFRLDRKFASVTACFQRR